MSNVKKNKYLLKNTLLISLGSLGSKLITFFLVPLYTYVLSKEAYGTVDLITTISIVIIPIITLNIQESVMRFTMDKNSNFNQIVSVGLITMFITLLFGILSILILSSIDALSEYSLLIGLYMVMYGFSQFLLCFIRGQEKLAEYSIINIIQVFFIAGINVVSLLWLKLGVKGYLISYILSYFITSIICSIRINLLHYIFHFEVNKKLASEMIKYSVVLIPNSLMWWIMNSLDRIMVTTMIGLEENGLYAVSYKIPSIIITLTTIFNQAWMFSAIKGKDDSDKEEYTNNIYTFFYSMLIIVSLFLILIMKPLMKIYVGNDFYNAWLYMPPLVIGTFFLTLGTFISNEYTTHKDSIGFLKSSSFGAFINLILNFLFIPMIGVMGAAIATCVSYLGVFIFRLCDTRKYLKLHVLDGTKTLEIILLVISGLFVYFNNALSIIVPAICLILEVLIKRKIFFSFYYVIKKMGGKKSDL